MQHDAVAELTLADEQAQGSRPTLVVRSNGSGPAQLVRDPVTPPDRCRHTSRAGFEAWRRSLPDDPLEPGRCTPLSLLRRQHDVDVGDAPPLTSDPLGGSDRRAAPFAATVMSADGTSLRAATDSLGFRHLYTHESRQASYLSTSALDLSRMLGLDVDPEGIAHLCHLGWQLDVRTSIRGVTKLAPRSTLTLRDGRCTIERTEPGLPVGRIADPAGRAAALLRSSISALLDDQPDAVLQLTGGMDSRLLLAAIPTDRRSDVEVLTLAVPGSEDLPIARSLAERFGMRHQVITMSGLEAFEPAEAYDRCIDAARRLECGADPLGYAALRFAESQTDGRPRIAGLGGEVARGFYYFGRIRPLAVTRERVERLARWRMFPNESVPSDVLCPAFARWSYETTIEAIHQAFASFDCDWFSATDEFYLLQRMQRWAGVLATADCMNRVVVNPMLDNRFLDIARSTPPEEKQNARLLSRILLELDADLARVPMDGRPPPIAYTQAGRRRLATSASVTARKVAGKASQRVLHRQRPPVGAPVLARLVVRHWRDVPEVLDPIRRLQIVDERWIDRMLSGGLEPSTTAVSLAITLLAATT